MAPAAASSSTMPQSPALSSFPIGNGLTISSTRNAANAKRSDQGAIPCGPPGGDPHAAGLVEHEPAGVFVADARAEEDVRAPDGAREREHGEDRGRGAVGLRRDEPEQDGGRRAATVPGAFGARPVPKNVALLQPAPVSGQQPAPPAYKPELIEFMVFTQIRHARLWLAGNAGNWELAEYEIDEFNEVLQNAAHMCPTTKAFPSAR